MLLTGILGYYPIKIGIVAITIVLSVQFIKNSLKLFFDKTQFFDEKREETLLHFANQTLKFLGVILFIMYLFSHFYDLTKLLTGSVLVASALALILQHIIRDYIMGFTFLGEKQLQHGDFVRINNKQEGIVEEIGMRHIKVRQWDGHLYTISYSNITELQNGNRKKRRVVEKIVLNYRQDPEVAINVLENVVNVCNEKYSRFLLKDKGGNPLETYQVHGITNLNAQFQGIEYAVTALVEDRYINEATNALRMELAKAIYKNELKMAETSVFYKTRATNYR